MKRQNFSSLQLNALSFDQVREKSANVITLFGGEDRIVERSLSISCWKGDYEAVRQMLTPYSFQPWHLSFSAVSKYTLDTLDAAAAENDSFLFRAFTLDPPGVGEVYVDLYYNHGVFTLTFYFDYEEDEQEDELHRLITAWAGDRDIIDHTLI